MKKILLTILVFLFYFLHNSFVEADTIWEQTPSEEFAVTIQSVKLFNSDTSEWVTVVETDQEFDFVSVGADTVIDQYGSQVTDFGVGNYTKAKIKFLRSTNFRHHFVDDLGLEFPDKYTVANYLSDTAMIMGDIGPAETGTLKVIDDINFLDVPAEYTYVLEDGYVEWEVPISFEKTAHTTQKIVIKFDISKVIDVNESGNLRLNLPIPYVTFE